MTLREVIERLDQLDGEDIFYVRRPWTSDADCTAARYDGANSERSPDGMDYVLEASKGWSTRGPGVDV